MTVQNINNVSQTFSMQDIANIAQPKPSGWSKFTSILGGIAGAASSFIPGAGIVGSLLGGLGGSGGGGGIGGLVSGESNQMQLLQFQYQIQQETQMFNLMTNISKDRHEAAMSAIRNMKS
jgi:hypothetical protein